MNSQKMKAPSKRINTILNSIDKGMTDIYKSIRKIHLYNNRRIPTKFWTWHFERLVASSLYDKNDIKLIIEFERIHGNKKIDISAQVPSKKALCLAETELSGSGTKRLRENLMANDCWLRIMVDRVKSWNDKKITNYEAEIKKSSGPHATGEVVSLYFLLDFKEHEYQPLLKQRIMRTYKFIYSNKKWNNYGCKEFVLPSTRTPSKTATCK
jgi:hypothetical protein